VFTPISEESSGPSVDDFWGRMKPSAFIGVCLNHRMSTASYLTRFVPWVAQNSSNLMILIFDYLERHNEVVFNGLSETRAAQRVLTRGQAIEKTCRKALSDTGHKEGSDFSILRFRDGANTASYKALYAEVQKAFTQIPAFYEDVHAVSLEFAARMESAKPKRFQHHTPQQDPHRLQEYLLEEIAMYLDIFYRGYTVEVYPGADSPILQNIAQGKYGVFPEYAERTHVSVTEKGQD
jgi:tRNA-dependent cyclodipeptide synthase